ncbi:MAG: 2'-deoxycytidine 5'-triphosphate deaminase, partial [Roseiarcus sp.]|uniref:2'-deoxycytidine 5'-triphosphate deaminase domain-containing protein n=1 Tax=Roseiarcus sp. TaxID=1969460 RepID=UPI003BB1DC40
MTTGRLFHIADVGPPSTSLLSRALASRAEDANRVCRPSEAPMAPVRNSLPHILDRTEPPGADALFSAPFGLFGRQKIRAMAGRKLIMADVPLEPEQFQPASLDLRISKEAYRVRASFLPGRERPVRERLESLNAEPVSLAGKGAVLEKGIV